MRRNLRLWIGTMNAVALLITSSALAKMEAVTCEYKYVLGDNVTKHEARKIAFQEAKRRCAEQIGTLLVSETVVSSSDLTKDEIRAYSLSDMKTEILSESFLSSGDGLAVLIKLKAHYDSDLAAARLKELLSDRGKSQEFVQAQEQIAALEKQVASLQRQLSVASPDERQALQRERRALESERQRLTRNAKETFQEKFGTSARSPSLTEDLAKDLDEEHKKIKKPESSQLEAIAPSVKAVDTALKVSGLALGSNAYLALARQRISNCWSTPPLNLAARPYIAVVQFRIHRNGMISGVAIEQSSGNEYYDLSAKRAVSSANPLPVFPSNISDSYLDAHFTVAVSSTEKSVVFP